MWMHDEGAVRTAGVLILKGQSEVVYRWLKSRPGEPADPRALVFLKDVFVILLRQNAHDAILAAALKAPARELFAVVPGYFAACVFLHRRQFETGFALLHAFRDRCLQNLERLPTDDADGFMVLFRQSLLLDDERYLSTPYYRDHQAINEAQLDDLHWIEAPPDGPEDEQPVILVSCDQKYAGLFLTGFLASVERLCRDRLVHVHLMDPQQQSPRLDELPVLDHNRLALTWERCGSLKCSAWYASGRFVRMPELLRRYRRPIYSFDADVTLNHPIERIGEAMTGADFGCFQWDFPSPCSVYLAAVTAFMPTAAGLEFATLVRNLILSKMSMQRPLLWLIDQAALYSAVYILAEKAGRLRISNFTRNIGMRHDDYIALCGQEVDKLRLMKQASGIDDDRAVGYPP
jgi:hypothetical protein